MPNPRCLARPSNNGVLLVDDVGAGGEVISFSILVVAVDDDTMLVLADDGLAFDKVSNARSMMTITEYMLTSLC